MLCAVNEIITQHTVKVILKARSSTFVTVAATSVLRPVAACLRLPGEYFVTLQCSSSLTAKMHSLLFL